MTNRSGIPSCVPPLPTRAGEGRKENSDGAVVRRSAAVRPPQFVRYLTTSTYTGRPSASDCAAASLIAACQVSTDAESGTSNEVAPSASAAPSAQVTLISIGV